MSGTEGDIERDLGTGVRIYSVCYYTGAVILAGGCVLTPGLLLAGECVLI